MKCPEQANLWCGTRGLEHWVQGSPRGEAPELGRGDDYLACWTAHWLGLFLVLFLAVWAKVSDSTRSNVLTWQRLTLKYWFSYLSFPSVITDRNHHTWLSESWFERVNSMTCELYLKETILSAWVWCNHPQYSTTILYTYCNIFSSFCKCLCFLHVFLLLSTSWCVLA